MKTPHPFAHILSAIANDINVEIEERIGFYAENKWQKISVEDAFRQYLSDPVDIDGTYIRLKPVPFVINGVELPYPLDIKNGAYWVGITRSKKDELKFIHFETQEITDEVFDALNKPFKDIGL